MKSIDLIRIGEQCLDALAYLHKMGCAYDERDPDKIYLLGNGDTRLELPPWRGLMSLIDPDLENRIVSDAQLLYVSPETIKSGRGDFRSELYSFGLVLYKTLTGCNRRTFAPAAAGAGLVRHALVGLPTWDLHPRPQAGQVFSARCSILPREAERLRASSATASIAGKAHAQAIPKMMRPLVEGRVAAPSFAPP